MHELHSPGPRPTPAWGIGASRSCPCSIVGHWAFWERKPGERPAACFLTAAGPDIARLMEDKVPGGFAWAFAPAFVGAPSPLGRTMKLAPRPDKAGLGPSCPCLLAEDRRGRDGSRRPGGGTDKRAGRTLLGDSVGDRPPVVHGPRHPLPMPGTALAASPGPARLGGPFFCVPRQLETISRGDGLFGSPVVLGPRGGPVPRRSAFGFTKSC